MHQIDVEDKPSMRAEHEKPVSLPAEPLIDQSRQVQMLVQASGHDLHDAERLTFTDWSEEVYYLERVTLPDRDQALKVIREDALDDIVEVEETYMAWAIKPDTEDPWISPDGDEYREGWIECGPEIPGAVPFWKVDPYSCGEDKIFDLDGFHDVLEQSVS